MVPGEAKGMLISRLKQAMWGCRRSVFAPRSRFEEVKQKESPRERASEPLKEMPQELSPKEIPKDLCKEEAELRSEELPERSEELLKELPKEMSPKDDMRNGPQVFHMASDEESHSEESDLDFCPDFPTRPTEPDWFDDPAPSCPQANEDAEKPTDVEKDLASCPDNRFNR